jgi:uncharacterized protein (TIGR01777 family)
MHILMTGGTGLIGTAVCAALHQSGHDVTVLTRRQRAVTAEARFVTALEDCAGPVDAVINLAGAGLADRRWSAAYKREIISSRVDLTRELVEWLGSLERPPARLISASAIGYYGSDDEQIFTETSSVGRGFSAALCDAWESEARQATALGVKVVILRLGVVLAKRGGALEKMTQSFGLGVESWLGSGAQWLSWIHLTDVVRVICHVLAEDSPAGHYNTVAPEPVRHRELAREVGRRTSVWLRLGVPPFAAKLMAGEMAEELLLSGQNVTPERLLKHGFEFQYPDLATALGELISPRS